ncbi:Uncharacterised protein [Vibrio cholerae]|nr:Uncharacterised protein [Vibrio cholerae]
MRRCHLTGHKLIPNQGIQLVCIRFHSFQSVGGDSHIRRTNRFVRLLGILLAAIHIWLAWQIRLTVMLGDVATQILNRFRTQVG